MQAVFFSALFIALCPIVRFTQHLTVGYIGCAALTPRSYVVGVHFIELPNTRFICVRAERAQRTVGNIMRRSVRSLLTIHRLFCSLVEHANVQQFSVRATAQNILEYAFTVFNVGVGIQLLYLLGHGLRIIRRSVILLVKSAPLQAAHFFFVRHKDAFYPINNRIKIGLQFAYVCIVAVQTHIFVYMPFTHPFERGTQIVLTVYRTDRKSVV